jgi:Ca2+-binding EF-hand superfamily protein
MTMTMVNDVSERVFAAYDADRNGAIEFRGADRREMTRQQERVEPAGGANPFGTDQRLVRVTSTWTQVSLFVAADTDDDGSVTREEMQAAIAPFDADRDGRLSSRGWAFWQPPGELERFDRAYAEQLVGIARTPL